MRIFRGYKAELNINNTQRATLLRYSGTARWVWNWGLTRRIKEYKETGKSSTFFAQLKQLVALKNTEEYSWLRSVSSRVLLLSLRDLDQAYKNFFRRVKNGNKTAGFPKLKSRHNGIGGFALQGSIVVAHNAIKLPCIGWLKLKEHDYIPVGNVRILSAAVSEKAGHWFVSVQCEEEIVDRKPTKEPIGIDLGIKSLAVTLDGRVFKNPKALYKSMRKLKRLQRELSRRKRGGKNWKKTKTKLARQHYRVVNIRKDALHKATSSITATNKPDSETPNTIVIENLNVSGMMKNHHLSLAISDVGFGEFRRQIEYKCSWYGINLIVADRFYPSSKICSNCGNVNSELKLSDREWICSCGSILDRDLNAAINLRNLAITTAGSAESNACGE